MSSKRTKKGKVERLSLPNGCSCSYPAISPADWQKTSKSMEKEWYIHYRFYDPTRVDSATGEIDPKAIFGGVTRS